MEWYYYTLIIVGIGLGLVLVYIVLRRMNIIGEIPILSNVIDPILNTPFIAMQASKTVFDDDFYAIKRKTGKKDSLRSLHWGIDSYSDDKGYKSLKRGLNNTKTFTGYDIDGEDVLMVDSDKEAIKMSKKATTANETAMRVVMDDIRKPNSAVIIGSTWDDLLEQAIIINDGKRYIIAENSENDPDQAITITQSESVLKERIGYWFPDMEVQYENAVVTEDDWM